KFFNPNICHICKKIFTYSFIMCDHCHMLIYCSQEHKELHQSEHMQICMVVKELLNIDARWDIRRFHKQGWIQSRKELIRLTKEKLSRNLELYEMEMIMFTKSCRICYKQANLEMCVLCFSANYCNDHEEIFRDVHISNCYNQLLRLILKIALINDIPALLKFNIIFDTNEPFKDMNAFVQKHLKTEPYKELSDTVLPYDYLYSQYASGPLTLYHGLRDVISFKTLDVNATTYVIHIIGVSYQPKEYIVAWELFLHLLNHIQHLTIIMTEMNSSTGHFVIDVCTHCRERNRTINIEYYSMSYCSYVQINAYKQPNVIIGFQINFDDRPTWRQSILALRKQKCPLFLTFMAEFEMLQCIDKLRVVFHPLLPVYFGENDFRSLAPCRSFGSDEVLYRNNYLAII
ncbi:hypothetical protein EAI_11990, partial [Harpegnathos saltator]